MPNSKLAWRMLFTGLLALLVFGFLHNRLWTQPLWYAAGWKRVWLWSVGFPVLFAAIALLRPRQFRQIGLGLVLLLTIVSVGIGGPFVALLLFFSAWQLGQLVFGEVRRPEARLAILLAGIAIDSEAIGLLSQIPVLYPAFAWAVLIAPLLARRKEAVKDLRRVAALISRPAPRKLAALAGLGTAAFVILAQWSVTLKPEASADGLAMHLAIPARIYYDHFWHFDVTRSIWAVMPMGGDWFYTVLYLAGGEFAARLGNFGLLVVLCGLTFHLTRRFLPKGYAYLAAALFASTPMVQMVTGSLMVENFWASMLFGALIAADLFRRSGERRYLLCASLLLGVAMASKFGAFGFAVPLFIAMWFFVRKRGLPASALAAPFGLMLLLALPTYLNAYLRTGNPVFPFMNNVFRSPYYETESIIDDRFMQPVTWRTLYDLTFHCGRYFEGQDGAGGFHYLVFLPIALLLVRPRRYPAASLCLTVAMVYALATLVKQPNLRYLYAACAPLTVAFAAAWAEFVRKDKLLAGAAVSATAGLIFLNFCFLSSSGWYHKEFFLLRPQNRVEYLERSASVRGLVRDLNRKRPGEPAVFLDTDQIAELRGQAHVTNWHEPKFLHLVYESSSPADLDQRLEEAGVRILVTPTPAPGHPLSVPAAQELVQELATPLARSGPFTAWEIKPEYSGRDGWQRAKDDRKEQAAVPPGEYDDPEYAIRFTGFWTRQKFDGPIGGSITYSDTPGDTVRFVFSGTEVTWYFAKAFNRGRAEVYIDGAKKCVVDQYDPKVQWRSSAVFSGLPPGKHVFELKLTGDKSAAATGRYIDVDELKVR